jgi:acyl-CoA synthetase (AMP-forming)/AMP-acid ligase II/thioesterase domain-containing protein/acyl carrier protein
VGIVALRELVPHGERASLEYCDHVYEPPEFWRAVEARSEDLLDSGLRQRDVVVLNGELSDDYVLTLLASLSMDLVVIPTDSRTPPIAVEAIVQASQAAAVLGPGGVVRKGISGGVLGTTSPELQYILFTSGSTGRPKGVLGTRDGLANRVRWGSEEHYGGSAERCAVRTSPTFVDSLTEILCSVAASRRLVVAPPSAQRDIGELTRFAHESRIDQLTITPSTIPVIAQAATAWPLTHVQRWIFSGEELRSDWCAKVRGFSPEAEIINSFGSTEVTGDVAYFKLAVGEKVPEPVPIGSVVAGVAWKLHSDPSDTSRRDSQGELLVGGPQVALGYLNGADEDRFLTDDSEPASYDARWFRTGDNVAVQGEHLHYIGRLDDLVKVRGQRVDLNGVAAALESVLTAAEAAVWVEETDEMTALVAAVGGLAESTSTVERLLERLREHLPPHMVPDKLVRLETLPRTVSGKIDRNALRTKSSAQIRPREEQFATGMEYAVAVALAEVMDSAELEPQTILSDAGLDSLRTVVAAERLSRTFGCEVDGITLRTLNTIESIASAVLRLQGQAAAVAWREVRRGQRPQIVFIHPAIGTGLGYFPLIARLPTNCSVALVEQTPDATQILVRDGIDGLASHYAALIQRESYASTVQLVGHSFGGVLLPAIANEILRRGGSLAQPVMLDPRIPASSHHDLNDWALRRVLTDSGYAQHLPDHVLSLDDALRIVERVPGHLQSISRRQIEHWADSLQANSEHLVGYQPPEFAGPATVVTSTTTDAEVGDLVWLSDSLPRATIEPMDCSHYEMLRPPNVSNISDLLARLSSTHSDDGTKERQDGI